MAIALAYELGNSPKQPVAVVSSSGKLLAGPPVETLQADALYKVSPRAIICKGTFQTGETKASGRVKTKCSNGLIGQVRVFEGIYGNITLAGSATGTQLYEKTHILECEGRLRLKKPVAPFLMTCVDVAETPIERPTVFGDGVHYEYETTNKRLSAVAFRSLRDGRTELTVWINPPEVPTQ